MAALNNVSFFCVVFVCALNLSAFCSNNNDHGGKQAATYHQRGLQNLSSPPSPICNVGKDAVVQKFVPPAELAPKSLKEALAIPMNEENGNCYPGNKDLIRTGMCCCAFWPVKPFETSLQRQMRLQDGPLGQADPCTMSWPLLQHQQNPTTCANVAVAVSGGTRYPWKRLADIQKFLAGPGDAYPHVFMHIGLENGSKRQPLSYLSEIPSEFSEMVKSAIIESKTHKDKRIANAIHMCTRGMQLEFDRAMSTRYTKRRDRAISSFMFMFRHIFLAHRLVRLYEHLSNCTYKHEVRTRPDIAYGGKFGWKFDWTLLPTDALVISTRFGLNPTTARHGVDEEHYCVTDDVFAVGTPAQMDGYCSVFPDYSDFVKYMLFNRVDLNGHSNERTLVTHLHYRSIQFKFWILDLIFRDKR